MAGIARRAATASVFFFPFSSSVAEAAVRPINLQNSVVNVLGASGAGEQGFAAYLSSLHTVGVAAVAAIAVVTIVYGAVLVFGESVWGKKSGKEKIWNAVWGLLLAAGSYVILGTVSQSLLRADFNLSANLGSTAGGTRIGAPSAGGGAVNRPGVADPNFRPDFLSPDDPFRARITTYYHDEPGTDQNTLNFRSSTGVALRYADANTVGVAAVDPSIIPYGSLITMRANDGTNRYFIAADTGSAVVGQVASNGSAPVIDIFSRDAITPDYSDVTVTPYSGESPFRELPREQQESFFNIDLYR